MSSLPSTSGQPSPTPQRSASLVIGSQSFVSVLLRCTLAELYKIRRRLMPKILLPIAVFIVVIAFSFITLGAFLVVSQRCTPADNGQQNCTPLTSAERADVSSPLRLPTSLTISIDVIDVVGPILLIILAGVAVGGEYGAGTIRVLLTRGPTRTQYLLAKILAILACVAITLIILVPLGIILGALYNLFTGINVDFAFFTGDWILHAIVYLLLEILKLFTYTMIALWLATLGRSTAAGIAGGIVWWFLEGLLTTILTIAGLATPGSAGNFLKAIPDYFLANNFSALLTEQSNYLTSFARNASTSASNAAGTIIPDWRAWFVIAVYLVIFLGTTWWVSQNRDITN
jgi:ABC-type transport system involved in multi-copper enzyme maturation permease subunit